MLNLSIIKVMRNKQRDRYKIKAQFLQICLKILEPLNLNLMIFCCWDTFVWESFIEQGLFGKFRLKTKCKMQKKIKSERQNKVRQEEEVEQKWEAC